MGKLLNRMGLTQPHRSSSIMAMEEEFICKFTFYVFFDTIGFYVMYKHGCISHTSHAGIKHVNSIFLACLIGSAEKEIA